MSAYGYVRVSTLRQAGEGDSLAAQRRQLEGYAQMRGLVLDHVFVEEGVSGSVPVAARPCGGALVGMLVAGDVLVAAKLDRLFRSALDALRTVEDLRARGVHLHLIDLGGDVASSSIAKMFLTVAAAFAEAERDRIRERVLQTCADLRSQGKRTGGPVPFGYRAERAPDGRGTVLVEDEAEMRFVRRVLAPLRGRGMSCRELSVVAGYHGHRLGRVAVGNVLRRYEEARR